jgi:hypothetical protein
VADADFVGDEKNASEPLKTPHNKTARTKGTKV